MGYSLAARPDLSTGDFPDKIFLAPARIGQERDKGQASTRSSPRCDWPWLPNPSAGYRRSRLPTPVTHPADPGWNLRDAQPENTCRIMKTRENKNQDAHDGRGQVHPGNSGSLMLAQKSGQVTRAHDRRARALTQAVSVVEWPMQRLKGRSDADYEQAPLQ
jgi:hypothetical protein